MMDTVWMKLTVVAKDRKTDQYFMFGPSGIVNFSTVNDVTTIIAADRTELTVEQDATYIVGVLQTVRRTEGVMDGNEEQDEETQDSSAEHSSKAPSEVHQSLK